jgi:DnaK suppressor protein
VAKANTKASSKPRAKRPAPSKAKPAASRPAASATKKKIVASKATAKSPAKKPAPAKKGPAPVKKAAAKAKPAPVRKAPAPAAKPVAKASAAKTAAPKAAPAKATKPVASKPAPKPVAPPPATKPAAAAPKAVAKPVPPPPPAVETPIKSKTKAEPSRKPAAPPQPVARQAAAPTEKAVIRKVTNLDDIKLPQGYRPSPNEEYMNPMHLAYFRQKLDNWRQELITESQETLEHLRTETRDVGDEAERASRESDNILELRTRDRYRKLLHKIEEAIKRIEEGSYGYCEETGEEIGLGRLEARPIATLTVDAQERREMFQKQFRDDH